MITATQAKELYDQSGVEVEQFLKHTVEPEVTKAAKSGKRQAFIHLGSLESYRFLDSVITPVHRQALDQLKLLGYRTVIKWGGDKYVPRGLVDDDGNGPIHQNYGIQIEW